MKLNIDQVEGELKTNESNIIFNKGEEDHIIKVNKDKVKSYRDELNVLNQGAFNTEQQIGETEQEYLDRLEKMQNLQHKTKILMK